jgi:molybdopterin-containing oxidoreductase family molybdopterin binding subunit
MRELPDPRYNRICSKGLTHIQRIYNEHRIKYPMKRVGERGAGEWERISWDEAIETIVEKWKSYQEQYGVDSFFWTNGSGNYASCSGIAPMGAWARFQKAMGMPSIGTSLDLAWGYVAATYLGNKEYGISNEAIDLLNAKTIICWGGNPVISQMQTTHFILEAKDRGAKYIVIDPVYSINASKADMWVPIRPGSDGALAFGMMNVVLREGWQDEEFLRAKTVAPYLVKDSDGKYLRLSDIGIAPTDGPLDAATGQPTKIDPLVVWDLESNVPMSEKESKNPALEGKYTIDGVSVTSAYSLLLQRIAEYPLSKVEELTTIPIETIEELARIYTQEGPSTIYLFFGLNHYTNGHYSYRAQMTLALLTGNIGKPGAAYGVGQNRGGGGFFLNAAVNSPTGAPANAFSIPLPQMTRVLEEKEYAGKPVDARAVYITHFNLLNNMADRNSCVEWLSKLEFIVVADLNMNETAQFADIVLPASHWFETEDLFTIFHTHPYFLWQDKAIEPMYESKPDFEIYRLIAAKAGRSEFFDLTQEEYLTGLLDSDAARQRGLTYENLRTKKAVRCLPNPYGGTDVFPTKLGRAQFYTEPDAVAVWWNNGQEIDKSKETLVYWEPPHEAWYKNELVKKYPLQIMSEHSKFRTHSQWWEVPALLEVDVQPLLKINPIDANQYAIKEGDRVRLFNDRGFVVMTATLNPGVMPGVLVAPKGWEKSQFIEGHFSSLSSKEMNQVCNNQPFNDVLVAIEKV